MPSLNNPAGGPHITPANTLGTPFIAMSGPFCGFTPKPELAHVGFNDLRETVPHITALYLVQE